MTQPFWTKFDLLTRTDILCGANGLTYGTDYGQGFYSSSNAGITHHTLKAFPHVSTFKELAECIGNHQQTNHHGPVGFSSLSNSVAASINISPPPGASQELTTS